MYVQYSRYIRDIIVACLWVLVLPRKCVVIQEYYAGVLSCNGILVVIAAVRKNVEKRCSHSMDVGMLEGSCHANTALS